MFNFNINFIGIIRDNLPSFLQTPVRLSMLKALSKPFRVILSEFKTKKDELFYKGTFNGAVIYLETALNDRFDPINRGITITDAFYEKVFIYRRSESKPPLILYRKWNSATNFVTGKFCYYQGTVYESNTTPNINKVPGVAAEWTATTRKAPVLRMRANYNGSIQFYVNVPGAVTFVENEMKALINYYKLAGIGYLIRIV